MHQDSNQHSHGSDTPPPGGVKDPVCGMTVDSRGTPYRTGHRGIVYYFCCAGCQKTFAADPDRFRAAAK